MDASGVAEASKFKKFLKRFGRRPSDEENRRWEQNDPTLSNTSGYGDGAAEGNLGGEPAPPTGDKKSNSTRSKRANSKFGAGKRSDSLLSGRFFQMPSSAPSVPQQQQKMDAQANSKHLKGSLHPDSPSRANDLNNLANTLTIPSNTSSPPPQIVGLPSHEPIATSDVISTQSKRENRDSLPNRLVNHEHPMDQQSHKGSTARTNPESFKQGASNTLSINSSVASATSYADPSFDVESSHRRDSIDNQTNGTGKSRASTKPTTLMSLETRDNVHSTSYAPIAQGSQARAIEHSAQGSRPFANRSGEAPSGSVQFASAPPMGRSASGTIIALPGQDEQPEDAPYTNVPTLTRPHPSNNPHPTGTPADNASVLTLASSTAAASIGGAASSRGHSHAAPSLGGARSVGGSVMGDRRNSSDTYASVKALPPLSRRGSDSSQRTGLSVAASATGRNSAQAMMGSGVNSGQTGPGAPGDRISIHRTPSQRTVATQLSIPLSTSNQGISHNGQGDGQASFHSSTAAGEPNSQLGIPAVSAHAPSNISNGAVSDTLRHSETFVSDQPDRTTIQVGNKDHAGQELA